MNQGKMFLTITDLQGLMGTSWYCNAQRKHIALRRRIAPDKRDLTIREYCELMGLRYRATTSR